MRKDVVIFIFFISFYYLIIFVSNAFAMPSLQINDGTKIENTVHCLDSDDGVFSSQKGIVSTKNFLGISRKYADRCQDLDGKDAVREYYCENGRAKWQKIVCEKGCQEDQCIQSSAFKYSSVIVDWNSDHTKQNQYTCTFDEKRNKVAIIIKKGGIADITSLETTMKNYFGAVKKHLNIEDAGVRKFSGSRLDELDVFVEDLVKNENVGYIIMVGNDLPINWKDNYYGTSVMRSGFPFAFLENLTYVGRGLPDSSSPPNLCLDVAISVVPTPEYVSQEEINRFLENVFANFAEYHTNPEKTFNTFGKNILYIGWDDNLDQFGYDLSVEDPQKDVGTSINRYFYPLNFLRNSQKEQLTEAYAKKKLFLMYYVHGAPNELGLGLSPRFNGLWTSNEDIISLYEKVGKTQLFVDVRTACNNDAVSMTRDSLCCWPQTWLKTGAWAVTQIFTDSYEKNFHQNWYREKVLGKALKRTYSGDPLIYGDILATTP